MNDETMTRVNLDAYEKCATTLEKFDWLLSTQGKLRFAGKRHDESQGEAYGIALLEFMEDHGVELRSAIAALSAQEAVAHAAPPAQAEPAKVAREAIDYDALAIQVHRAYFDDDSPSPIEVACMAAALREVMP